MIAELSLEEKNKKSSVIQSQIVNLVHHLQESSVLDSTYILGLYAPMIDEVQLETLSILEDRKVTSAFPYSDNGLMDFRKCAFHELQETDLFGVKLRTPPKEAEVVTPSLLLIPGMAFDKKGGRLGRGKGFYDRFLSEFKGLKVGICFEEQLVDTVPREDHDVSVDFVVSERGITRTAYI